MSKLERRRFVEVLGDEVTFGMPMESVPIPVKLRPLTAEDIHHLVKWDSDPEIASLIGQKFQAERDAFSWFTGLSRANGRVGFAIEIGEVMIGDIELEHISWRSGEAEVRICLGEKRYWDHGYGTQALARLLDYAFGELDLFLVYLRVLHLNRRAIRAYEKLGFRKRGRLLATGRLRGGNDLVLMEITRDIYGLWRQCQSIPGWTPLHC